jgi:membrane AbrB-like protein
VAIFATMNRPVIRFPLFSYRLAQSIIGVMLSFSITAKSLQTIAANWLPVVVLVLAMLVLASLNGIVLCRFTNLKPGTALLGTLPGGAGEMIAMSDTLGADVRLVTVMQYGRLLAILATISVVEQIVGASGGPSQHALALEALSKAGLRLQDRRILGRVAGRADASRARQRAYHPDGLLHLPVVRQRCFIADSEFDGNSVTNGSQQQWLIRNSELDGWTNGVWNQVFSGVVGAPAQCFPLQPNVCGPYTTLPSSPVTREAPFLYVDGSERFRVFVPAVQRNSVGTTWGGGGSVAGSSISIDDFFVAKPTDSVQDF